MYKEEGPFAFASAQFTNFFRSTVFTYPAVRRVCPGCASTHRDLYYKRITNPASWDVSGNLLTSFSLSGDVIGTDFKIYGSLDDYLSDTNGWQHCAPDSRSAANPLDNHWTFSTWAENSFFEASEETADYKTRVHIRTLHHGYRVALTGWTHQRDYAGGFLNNIIGDKPTATVTGLVPNKVYKWAIYSFTTQNPNYITNNLVSVNNGADVALHQSQDKGIALSGEDTATADGTLLFTFTNIAGSGSGNHHVHLSSMSVVYKTDTVAQRSSSESFDRCHPTSDWLSPIPLPRQLTGDGFAELLAGLRINAPPEVILMGKAADGSGDAWIWIKEAGDFALQVRFSRFGR